MVPPGPKYIGIRTGFGPFNYGWIQITVLFPPAPFYAIVHDWAYEDIAGLAIQAGSLTSLSVQMTDFNAGIQSDGVQLSWVTQSEVNNRGFILNRRELDADGNIMADWAEMASYITHPQLQGQGNRSEATQYNFLDVNAIDGAIYEYQLTDVDIDGNSSIHPHPLVHVQHLSPDHIMLEQNYPNPFNPKTTIRFGIPEADQATLSVYNLKGQTVEVLLDEYMEAGYREVPWDGSQLPAGIYFYELRAGTHREIRKLNLVK